MFACRGIADLVNVETHTRLEVEAFLNGKPHPRRKTDPRKLRCGRGGILLGQLPTVVVIVVVVVLRGCRNGDEQHREKKNRRFHWGKFRKFSVTLRPL